MKKPTAKEMARQLMRLKDVKEVSILNVSRGHMVKLWYETQMGSMKRCKEAQAEFSNMMWVLYEDMQPEVFETEFDVKKSLKDLTAFDTNNKKINVGENNIND